MGSIREVGIEWGRVGHGEVDRVVAMGWMDGPTMIKSNISRLLEVAAQWVQVRAQWVQVCVGIGTRLDRVGATQSVESRSEKCVEKCIQNICAFRRANSRRKWYCECPLLHCFHFRLSYLFILPVLNMLFQSLTRGSRALP